jgi:sigma-B regulation protein RsbU (phosphoserine phosphatase)
MFRSFRTRLLLVLLLVLVCLATSVILLVQNEVNQSFTASQEQDARNVLRLAYLNVESQNEDLLAHRDFALEERKTQILDLSHMIQKTLDSLNEEARTPSEMKTVQTQALAWLKGIRYRNDDYFFTYNMQNIAIAHADPRVEGKDMSDYMDPKGNHVMAQIHQIVDDGGGGFLTFWFTRLDSTDLVEKLGYVFLYQPWHWIIGTGVYIDDIQAEAEQKKAQIIATLQQELDQVKIAETGFLFLFDSSGRLLSHPLLNFAGGVTPGILAVLRNPASGQLLIADLKAAAANPEVPLRYLWDKPEDLAKTLFPAESYVQYVASLDWYLASFVYTSEMQAPGQALAWQLVGVMGGIFLLALLVMYFAISRMARPLQQLACYTTAFSANQFRRPMDPNLQIDTLPDRYQDEIGQLATSFLALEDKLGEYIENLRVTTAAKERIESDLRVAHDIQLGMVPKDFPPFPGHPETPIYALMEPAREVGGDLYDFQLVGDRSLVFLIGDVSGKGVSGALVMASTLTLFRASAPYLKSPAEILGRMNAALALNNDSCMFVTAFCGSLDLETGHLVYANAGHNPPFLVEPSRVQRVDEPPGIVLGFLPEFVFRDVEVQLHPGCCFFAYTDGVVEAQNRDRAFYGEPGLVHILEEGCGGTPKQLVELVAKRVRTFEAGAEPSDDVTLLAIRFRQDAA